MKNLHFILYIFVALTCMTAVQSCIKDKIEEDPSKILLNMVSVDKPELDFVVIQDSKVLTITSRFRWNITAEGLNGTDGGWYTISAVSGDGDDEINVTTKPNPTEVPRTATLIITGRYNAVEVIISQAKDGEGMLDEENVTLDDFNCIEAETQIFDITTPFEWTITFKDKTSYTDPESPAINPVWATVDVVDGKGEGDGTITVTVEDNNTGDKRMGEFTITAVGKTKIITVNQIADLDNTFDAKFLAWCLDPDKGNVDTDDDGSISVKEAEAVTSINCSNLFLESLKGVENFTELTELECFGNNLTELDVSKNTELTGLGCAFNDLTALDMSKNTELTYLYCYSNKLTTLDVSKNTELTYLDCRDNNLSTLDVSKNTVLTYLSCHSNPNLAEINISGSSFETLFFFNCTSIETDAEIRVWSGFNPQGIIIGNWQVSSTTYWKVPSLGYAFSTKFLAWCLDPDKGNVDTDGDGSISVEEAEAVTIIDCSNLSLGSLKGVENFTKLTELRCYNNSLTKLLDMSKNTELTYLNCTNNGLGTLDVSKNTKLTELYCHYNNLTKLDVSENTKLTYLYCDNNPILAKINISGSSFATLIFFNCNYITPNAKIHVWSGFDIANIPAASIWKYPVDIAWMPLP